MTNTMNELTSIFRILWEKTEQKQARILRIFGCCPSASVPSYIEGYPVIELGDYCFSKACHLPNIYETTYFGCNTDNGMTELCGNYVESVQLPDTLEKIGDYAFYDCRKLSHIIFGNKLRIIGSDAFMNCHMLHHLSIHCSIMEETGLRQILRQIFWDVEVSFSGNSSGNSSLNKLENQRHTQPQAMIYYPEYYEAYDEIAPAHIFERTIQGEGFRARQCFQDGIIDFAQYDTIFQKACAEESEKTICRIVYCRLRYPFGLSADKKKQYQEYIKAHAAVLCQIFIDNRQLEALSFLFQEDLLSQKDLSAAITMSSKAGWNEGTASILSWKHLNYQHQPLHKKYEFEEF